MSSRPLILSAGRTYCDLVFTGLDAPPTMGHEVFADELKLCAGGGAYITAAYFAALGDAIGLISVLPAAPFATLVQTEITENQIHPYTTIAQGTDVQLTAALVGHADRAFVTRRVGPAVPQSVIDTLPSAHHLHVGELTTALEHPDLLQAAQAAGMTISLDCGWDRAAFAHPDVARCIASVDLFLPNDAEAEALEVQGVAMKPKRFMIIKQGAEGAVCQATDGARFEVPAYPAQLVDTTGAGDAFNAGFVSAWLADASPMDAMTLGNACGAQAVSRLGGATDLPDLSALHSRHPTPQAAQ